MKALSIKQPYAQLIGEGIKPIENRSFRTHFRGRTYIHASAQWHDRLKTDSLFTKEQWESIHKHNLDKKIDLNLYRYLQKEVATDKLPVSAIIGEVDIVDCVLNHPSIWAEKTVILGKTIENKILYDEAPIWNWVLANPILYDKPILNVKGKLSFWYPDTDIVECIGCSQKFDSEIMEVDDANEKYCPECWEHFEPILAQEAKENIESEL